MGEDTKIRLQRVLHGLFGGNAAMEAIEALLHLPEHAAFRLRPQNTVMRQQNAAEEINALTVFPDCHLARMQSEAQLTLEKMPNGREKIPQKSPIVRHDHEIIGVANIGFDP